MTTRPRFVLPAFLLFALTLALGGLVAVPAVSTAQDDERVTETPEISTFTKLRIEGAGNATISIGDEPSVTIEAPALIIELIDISVDRDELKISFPEGTALDLLGEADITYSITAPSLEEIHLSGSVNATVDQLTTDTLFIGLTAFAELRIDALIVDQLDAKLDFSSTAHLTGTVDSQTIKIVNASNYNAGELESRETTVDLSELSDTTVRVLERLSGKIGTAATLSYIGESIDLEVDSSGLASIVQLPFTDHAFDPPAPPSTPESASAPMDVEVGILAFAFDPFTIEVALGGTVTWVNHDMIPHDIAETADIEYFHSPLLAKEQTYSVTFDKPGTYIYHCPHHPIMTGEIIVREN